MADATVKLLIAEGAFTDDEVKHSQGRMGGLPGGSEAGFVSSLMLVCTPRCN
jgi:hypothetical protein